jgi:purine nucleosidase
LLEALVTMGGVFDQPDPEQVLLEWNVLCDPHAAAIVFNAPLQRHLVISLDVTRRVSLGAPEVRTHFTGGILQPVLDFAEVWFRSYDRITFHDPLAGAAIFDPQMCEFRPGTVSVDLSGGRFLGVTDWLQEETSGKHQIAVDVNVDRFFRHFFGVVGSEL